MATKAKAKAAPDEDLDSLLDESDEAAEEAFDLSDIEEATPGALEPGRYLCVVHSAKRDVVKSGDNKGQPKFAIRFQAIEPASNKAIFKHAQLKGAPAKYTKSLLRALGIDPSQPVRVSDLEGRKVYLHLSSRADKPTENEIDTWEAYAGEAAEAAVDDDELN